MYLLHEQTELHEQQVSFYSQINKHYFQKNEKIKVNRAVCLHHCSCYIFSLGPGGVLFLLQSYFCVEESALSKEPSFLILSYISTHDKELSIWTISDAITQSSAIEDFSAVQKLFINEKARSTEAFVPGKERAHYTRLLRLRTLISFFCKS